MDSYLLDFFNKRKGISYVNSEFPNKGFNFSARKWTNFYVGELMVLTTDVSETLFLYTPKKPYNLEGKGLIAVILLLILSRMEEVAMRLLVFAAMIIVEYFLVIYMCRLNSP